MLIELLWSTSRVETQDVIICQQKTERVIEIGPGDTLIAMARRTTNSKYQSHDAAHAIRRQLLCYKADAEEIYYSACPSKEELEPASGLAISAASSKHQVSMSPTTSITNIPTVHLSARPKFQVPDVSVTVAEIVRMIVTRTLRKSVGEIALSNTIRGLAGGSCFPLTTYHDFIIAELTAD